MQNYKGFTLIETLVVMAIMTIMIVVAVPNFNQMQTKARISSTASDLVSALKQGRSEALTKRINLQFAAVNSSASFNAWGSQGWQVKDTVTDKIYFEQHTLPPTIRIAANPAVTKLVFVATTGLVTKTDGTPVDMVFTVCDIGPQEGKRITMSRLGRITVTSTTIADCAI